MGHAWQATQSRRRVHAFLPVFIPSGPAIQLASGECRARARRLRCFTEGQRSQDVGGVFGEFHIAGTTTARARILNVGSFAGEAAAAPAPAASAPVFGPILGRARFEVVGGVAVKDYFHGFLPVVALRDLDASGPFVVNMRGTNKPHGRAGARYGRRSAHQHLRS
jgi:hypothetical protein